MKKRFSLILSLCLALSLLSGCAEAPVKYQP